MNIKLNQMLLPVLSILSRASNLLGSIPYRSPESRLRLVALSLAVAMLASLFVNVLPALALSPPSISPTTGTFTTSQSVTMTAGSGSIYYTLDGSQPTNASNLYSSAITVNGPTQINAVAYSSPNYSTVTTAYLDVDPTLGPVLQPAGLMIRLRAGLGVATNPGSPGSVTSWADLSGNNNSATGPYQKSPFLNISAINGLPTVNFNGAQYLSLPSGFANLNTITYVTCGGAPPPSGNGSDITITIAGTACNFAISTTDTNTNIATGLAAAINAKSITGVTATSSGAIIQITAPIATTYSTTVLAGLSLTVQPPGATVIVVTAPTSLPAGGRILDLGDAASGNNVICDISASGSLGQFSAFNGTSGTNVQSASALTQNQYQVLAAVQVPGASHGTATFFVNGTPGSQNTSMDNFPNVSRTSNFLGQASSGGSFFPGQICEVLFYSTSLSDSQIAAITGMFAGKYQLINQTPSAPIISVPAGTLSGPTQVTISGEPGVTVRFTTDGTAPSASSPAFIGSPLTINYTQTLKAAAFKNALQSSASSASYVLDSTQWPAPSTSDMTAPSINLQLPTPSI